MSTHGTEPTPDVGTLLHDTESDRVGEFRGTAGDRWTLRPPGGGVPWEVSPGAVEPAGTYDQVRARAAEENATRRAHRL